MKHRFVSIGECMVEMAPTGEGTFRMGFAGDTLNTAWYARKLLPADWDVSYVSCVGQDAASDEMLAFLENAGIETAGVRRLDDRTVGLYMIQLDKGERSFAYWRSDSAARQLASDRRRLARELEGAELIYFSGITLAILSDEDRQTFLQTLLEARGNGACVAFDPNLRPRLWPSDEAMCQAISEAASYCDIVLPSFEDEATFFGDVSPADTARRYADAGAGTVVVKNGGEDVVVLANGVVSGHAALRVAQIVDTTAAGDSFNAGFLSSWVRSKDLARAVSAGNQLASAVIAQRGALVDCLEPV
ncbi:sugar kinase [Roseibium sp.]|uniref:sugar kinase n=1 Tax=Roseibium sp. TaxID=1936156 RepID=UPI003A973F3F